MEKVIEILESVKPGVDFKKEKSFFSINSR